MTDAYDRGKRNRQKILDLLKECGPLCLTDIANISGASVSTTQKRIGRMVNMGEVVKGVGKSPKYTAAVRTTQSAEIDREAQRAAFERYNEARRKRFANQIGQSTKVIGNRIVHVCSDHLPTPPGYGGGQGGSKPRRASPITLI